MSTVKEVTALAKPADVMPIDRIPMDERRRRLIKIVMLIRYTFRGYFGLKFANKWGFYVDRHMSRKIHEFQDWPVYPKGDDVLEGHKHGVIAAVVSDDGCFLFTADEGGMIKVWNMLKNQKIGEWTARNYAIRVLAFRSGLLVSGSDDKIIQIWHTWRDYQLVHTLEGHTSYVSSVNINEKATEVISGSGDKSIRIWSVKTGECIRVLMGHSRGVLSVRLVGDLILSGSADKSIRVWNSSDGSEIKSEDEIIDGRISDLSVNCDATLVACVSQNEFTLLSWPELKLVSTVDANPILCVSHPTHPTIMAVTERLTNSIQVFDVTNYDVIRVMDGHLGGVSHLCFTPDGFRLISVSDDKSVRIWDVSDL